MKCQHQSHRDFTETYGLNVSYHAVRMGSVWRVSDTGLLLACPAACTGAIVSKLISVQVSFWLRPARNSNGQRLLRQSAALPSEQLEAQLLTCCMPTSCMSVQSVQLCWVTCLELAGAGHKNRLEITCNDLLIIAESHAQGQGEGARAHQRPHHQMDQTDTSHLCDTSHACCSVSLCMCVANIYMSLQGEIVDELAGLEDEDCFETGMAGIRGKAARAVIQKDMRRKQQARAAELAWQRYEVTQAGFIPSMFLIWI